MTFCYQQAFKSQCTISIKDTGMVFTSSSVFIVNPFHPEPEQIGKINFKFLFSHFFVVPKNVLWKP